MREIFFPTSVAVIGVSSKPSNLGRNIVGNLVEYGFNGIVYAVGPSGGTIETHRIYNSVMDIPDKVDLAVILTPAKTVPAVLEECGKKDIHWAIIETAGFREYTKTGQALEDQICEIANKYAIQFVGPNCIGAINMENGFCVPFPRLKKFIKQGDVSIITQSGGVGLSVLNLMTNEGMGLSKFVSVGNMLNKNAEDILEYLLDDDQTAIIFIYLESIGDGRRLMQIAKKSTKPIMIFKSNIGSLGQKIALSHTASLTSDDKVVDSAFFQSGIIRVRDATTLGNNLKSLGLPQMRGRNLGVIARSGGHAVIAADACELSGFNLASFPDSYLREIEKHFRASVIRLTNPLDLGDLFDLDVYAQIVEQTLKLPNVDGVVFLHTALSEAENLTSRQLLERIIKLVQEYDKPVAYYLSASSTEISFLKQNYRYPIFTQVVETVRALENSHSYFQMYQKIHSEEEFPEFLSDREIPTEIIMKAESEGRDLNLAEALELLEMYGIPTARGILVNSEEDALSAAQQIGFPLAIKIISPEISHKSDVGGVVLDLSDRESLLSAYRMMTDRIARENPGAEISGVLVQPMVGEGHELILGGRQDPQFGPVVLVGFGGIFVEVIGEVEVRVAPISRQTAEEMVQRLHGFQILKGVRGRPPADIRSLIDALLRLSQLLCDFPRIQEIDVKSSARVC